MGKSLLSFALALSQSGANTQFAASADFSAQLQLSFLEPEVIWFSLGATVAYDSLAPPPSVSFSIRAAVAATGNPFYIKGFSWIKIAYLGGEIGLTPMTVFPFVSLYKINFNAKGIVLSTNVSLCGGCRAERRLGWATQVALHFVIARVRTAAHRVITNPQMRFRS